MVDVATSRNCGATLVLQRSTLAVGILLATLGEERWGLSYAARVAFRFFYRGSWSLGHSGVPGYRRLFFKLTHYQLPG